MLGLGWGCNGMRPGGLWKELMYFPLGGAWVIGARGRDMASWILKCPLMHLPHKILSHWVWVKPVNTMGWPPLTGFVLTAGDLKTERLFWVSATWQAEPLTPPEESRCEGRSPWLTWNMRRASEGLRGASGSWEWPLLAAAWTRALTQTRKGILLPASRLGRGPHASDESSNLSSWLQSCETFSWTQLSPAETWE